MVLTHTTNYTYSHPLPTVTLAYFLRYCSPRINPFAKHVLSTDTLESRVDEETGRLHTTRIHLKKSRMPAALLKILPTSVTGGIAEKASYVLETSVVDIQEGWMQTESKNLNFTGVLSVVEKQLYTAPSLSATAQQGTTNVETAVIYRSRLGERIRERIGQGQQAQQSQQREEPRPSWFGKGGWVAGLGAKGMQRSIETIASTRTEDQQGKSREGMRVVLERLRMSGVMGVLEMSRRAMENKMDD